MLKKGMVYGLWLMVLSLISPVVAFAEDCTNGTQSDLGCIPNDPVGFTQKFYGIGLTFVGGIALLAIIYGGYLIMFSQGNPSQVAKGRGYIMYAIIGLVLAVGGFAFYQTIAANVLKIPGFGN